mmetsp:Transcript_16566/g.33596  ORF Transcript_16566/g.33596 Transcript_16566/m.33596 type:complete len:140 (-) Transcript_16566:41-460(-)|eukprot:CAMPEP_0170399668 /NCGR_PEP_ID=MMETSP0117_2-20130122/24083_1 /TAXON_ID=400756 /ORGANISM="Durinskia baltica, Strain CSIRO CS-38" /LENGTH=139 /DNA_ID=CAMNT_0010656357 /DNA_START=23 /DNA_END=442 /DNA_ORIENTATION=+
MNQPQTQATGLATVLEKFLVKIGDAKVFILSTFDGVELMTVYKDPSTSQQSNFDKHTIDSLVSSYATSIVQASKIGGGAPLYSMSWMERGSLIHIKLEALVVTLVMDDNANLGLIDEHIVLLKRILGPFSNSNFISVTL